VTEALGHDADVHGQDGRMDVTGNLLHGDPSRTHDNHGWPTFAGWPTYDTYTHQQVYYRWLQRAWLSGMRLVVAQLVEDQQLCEIEPSKSHSCDETATVELEAQRLQALQAYVDAQSGGPGRGWLRLVYDPAQARRAIRRGQLAMLMGVEASDPFGCSERDGQPQCTKADVDKGLVLYQHLGIRALFITHWVDNAFAGAALEGGDKGTFIGLFEVQQTGNPFLTGPCPEPGQGEEMPPLPGQQCNTKGLTDLGRYLVGRLMDDHMLIEADHLSERARLDVLDLAEARHYPLLSSHNNTGGFWTPDDLRRLHALGGYVSATPDVATKLATKIDDLGAYGFTGVGIGTDTGGFAALPEPAPDAATNPLRYPFRSYDGKVRFARQRSGTRTFDLNKDGVAHYGLMPDLIADVERRPGGARAAALLFGSAEAYLRTWEAAERR
jgi:microsomal dipeptidase-like Zn-dependent dipeptidase